MTHYECTACGHHYEVAINPSLPFTSKCPKCGATGQPSRSVPGWCKDQGGQT